MESGEECQGVQGGPAGQNANKCLHVFAFSALSQLQNKCSLSLTMDKICQQVNYSTVIYDKQTDSNEQLT